MVPYSPSCTNEPIASQILIQSPKYTATIRAYTHVHVAHQVSKMCATQYTLSVVQFRPFQIMLGILAIMLFFYAQNINLLCSWLYIKPIMLTSFYMIDIRYPVFIVT